MPKISITIDAIRDFQTHTTKDVFDDVFLYPNYVWREYNNPDKDFWEWYSALSNENRDAFHEYLRTSIETR